MGCIDCVIQIYSAIYQVTSYVDHQIPLTFQNMSATRERSDRLQDQLARCVIWTLSTMVKLSIKWSGCKPTPKRHFVSLHYHNMYRNVFWMWYFTKIKSRWVHAFPLYRFWIKFFQNFIYYTNIEKKWIADQWITVRLTWIKLIHRFRFVQAPVHVVTPSTIRWCNCIKFGNGAYIRRLIGLTVS